MGDTRESITIKVGFDNTEVSQGLLRMQAQAEISRAEMNAISAQYDREEQAAHLASVEKMIAADEARYAEQAALERTAIAEHSAALKRKSSEDAAYAAAVTAERNAIAAETGAANRAYESDYLRSVTEMIAADAARAAVQTAFSINRLAMIKEEAAANAKLAAQVLAEDAAIIAANNAEKTGGSLFFAQTLLGASASVEAQEAGLAAKAMREGGAILEGGASIPANMAGGAAKLAAIARGEQLVKEAEAAEKAAAGVAREVGGFGSIMRETAVLFREGMRGNWTRMIGSLSVLIGYIGGMAAMVAIPLAAILAVPGWKAYKAYKGEQDSDKDMKTAFGKEGEELRKRISYLRRAGVISEQQEADYARALKRGDVDSVLNATNPLLKNGSAADQAKRTETAQEAARINAQGQKDELNAYREGVPLLTKRMSLEIERHNILGKMQYMQRDSVEYARSNVEQETLLREIKKDQVALDKEKTELQKQYTEDNKKVRKLQGEMADIDVKDAIPSLEELAGGGGWLTREKKAYGPEAFNGGPFADAAREAIHAKNQEKWDIAHGNAVFDNDDHLVGGQAFEDRGRRMSAENMLRGAGLDTPEMKMAKMGKDMSNIQKGITGILAAATKDGIKLKDE